MEESNIREQQMVDNAPLEIFLQRYPKFEMNSHYKKWKNFFIRTDNSGKHFSVRDDTELDEDVIKTFDKERCVFQLLNLGNEYVNYYRDPFTIVHTAAPISSDEQYWVNHAAIKILDCNDKPIRTLNAFNALFFLTGVFSKHSNNTARAKFDVIRFTPKRVSSQSNIFPNITISCFHGHKKYVLIERKDDGYNLNETVCNVSDVPTRFNPSNDLLACLSNFKIKYNLSRKCNYLSANIEYVIHYTK